MSLDGTFNFRDIGGLPLAGGGGGHTLSGVLWRSDNLSGLTTEGLRQFGATGIRQVIDLRTPDERAMSPDLLPGLEGLSVIELPLLEGAVAELLSGPLDQLQVPSLDSLYRDMLQQGGPTFARAAELVAEAETGVLIQCSAGKDRTGVAVALLLDAVGTDRDAVIGDYAASTERLAGPWAESVVELIVAFGIEPTPEIIAVATTSPAEAITAVLTWLDQQGGSAAYLRSAGLSQLRLDQLAARLRG